MAWLIHQTEYNLIDQRTNLNARPIDNLPAQMFMLSGVKKNKDPRRIIPGVFRISAFSKKEHTLNSEK